MVETTKVKSSIQSKTQKVQNIPQNKATDKDLDVYIDKKLRNLEKRRTKAIQLKESMDKGDSLNEDQKKTVFSLPDIDSSIETLKEIKTLIPKNNKEKDSTAYTNIDIDKYSFLIASLLTFCCNSDLKGASNLKKSFDLLKPENTITFEDCVQINNLKESLVINNQFPLNIQKCCQVIKRMFISVDQNKLKFDLTNSLLYNIILKLQTNGFINLESFIDNNKQIHVKSEGVAIKKNKKISHIENTEKPGSAENNKPKNCENNQQSIVQISANKNPQKPLTVLKTTYNNKLSINNNDKLVKPVSSKDDVPITIRVVSANSNVENINSTKVPGNSPKTLVQNQKNMESSQMNNNKKLQNNAEQKTKIDVEYKNIIDNSDSKSNKPKSKTQTNQKINKKI